MPIAQRTSTSGTAAASAAFTVTLPTGTVAGDIIVLAVANAGTTTAPAPSGWTAVPGSPFSAGTGQEVFIYTAQYTANPNLNWTNASTVAAWVCNSYYQAGYTLSLDGNPVAANNTSNNTTVATGAPTTGAVAGDYEVLVYAYTSSATLTAATGMTVDRTQANSTSVSAVLGHNNTTSLGASTVCTAFAPTLSASNTRKTGVGVLIKATPNVVLTGTVVARGGAWLTPSGGPSDPYGSAVYREQGLVGYWRLDDATTTANDYQAASTHDGTYTGGVTRQQPPAVSNGTGSATFNGTTGYVAIPDFDTPYAASGFSMECWINANTWAANTDVWGRRGSDGNGGFVLQCADNLGRFYFYIYDATQTWIVTNTSRYLAQNQWHHVVATWQPTGTGTTGIGQVYINGALEATVNTNGVPRDPAVGGSVYIGGGPLAATYFNGSLSEVALYSQPLSVTQIRNHWRIGIQALDNYGSTIEAVPPVAYWRMHEAGTYPSGAAQGNIFDEQGNGLTMTTNDLDVLQGQGGLPGDSPSYCVYMDGSTSAAIFRSTADPVLNFGAGNFSLEGWIYQASSNGEFSSRPYVEFNDGTTTGMHCWSYPSGDVLYANFMDTTGTSHTISSAANTIKPDQWNHWAMVRNGNTGYAYVNGVQVGTISLTGITCQTALPFNIGYRPSGGGSFYWGHLTQVVAYNVALSAAQVTDHYNKGLSSGPAPVALTGASVAQAVATGAARLALTQGTVAQAISTGSTRLLLTGVIQTQAGFDEIPPAPTLRLTGTTVAQAGFDEIPPAPTLLLASGSVAQSVSTAVVRVNLTGATATQAVTQATIGTGVPLTGVSVGQAGFDEIPPAPTLRLTGTSVAQAASTGAMSMAVALTGATDAQAVSAANIAAATALTGQAIAQGASTAGLVILLTGASVGSGSVVAPNAPVVLEPGVIVGQGSSTATLRVGLAAPVVGQAASSGALTLSVALTGTTQAGGTTTGALAMNVALTGASSAQATTTVSLFVGQPLAVTTFAQASSAAALSMGVALTGAGATQAASTVGLTVGLTGSVLAVASSSATTTGQAAFVGASIGQASSTATLGVALLGASAAQAGTTIALTVGFVGATTAQAASAGSLAIKLAATTVAQATSASASDLIVTSGTSFSGVIVAQATSTAGLLVGLAGAVTTSGGAAAGLTLTQAFTGAAAGQASSSATVQLGVPADVALTGAISAQGSTLAALTGGALGVVQVSWIRFAPSQVITGSGDANGLPGDANGHGTVINPSVPPVTGPPASGGSTGPSRRPRRRVVRAIRPIYGYGDARGRLGRARADGQVLNPVPVTLAGVAAAPPGDSRATGTVALPVGGTIDARGLAPVADGAARVLQPMHASGRAIAQLADWRGSGRVLDCARGIGSARATAATARLSGLVKRPPAWEREELWLLGIGSGDTDEELLLI